VGFDPRQQLAHAERLGDEVGRARPSALTVASSGGIDEIIRTGTSRNRSSAFILASSCKPSTFGIMMSRSSRLGRSSSSLPMSPSPPSATITSYPFSFRIQVRVRTSD